MAGKVDLRSRLAKLVAAAPVVDPPGAADAVRRVRPSTPATRHGATVASLVAVLVLAVGLAGGIALRGGSGSTASPSAGAPSGAGLGATDSEGDFTLTLRSGKVLYGPNEPIDVSAALTYVGERPSVAFGNDSEGPIAFGITERVYGAIDVGTLSKLMCGQSTLLRGQPMVRPFAKGGSFSGDDPQASLYQSWFADPQLRLPEGTWHLYAVAQGGADCGIPGGASFDLRAEITIVVSADPAGSPSQATPAPPVDQPVYGGDDIGYMTLQVMSPRPTYELGTPVAIDTWFTLAEGPPQATEPFIQEVAFSIDQVDPNARPAASMKRAAGCTPTTLASLEERHVALRDATTVEVQAVSWPASAAGALANGSLDLPLGRWRITVAVTALFGPCGAATTTWRTTASIEVDVVPVGNAAIELATGGPVTDLQACGQTVIGSLEPDAQTGLGLTESSGVTLGVVWPVGYTARTENGRAVLFDASHRIVAEQGDRIVGWGAAQANGEFAMCGLSAPSPTPRS